MLEVVVSARRQKLSLRAHIVSETICLAVASHQERNLTSDGSKLIGSHLAACHRDTLLGCGGEQSTDCPTGFGTAIMG
ncbi:MAG: hypothetical protein ABF459_01130 [Gluconobacter cerinus]|uniref:hypothetical protein n=1 Tax=Gluconobacter TaxID=441 RepID=UPI0031F7DF0B